MSDQTKTQEPKVQEPKVQKPKKDESKKDPLSYFKSKIASLNVMVDAGDGVDFNTYKEVRFTAYRDTYKGDPIKVGYLATDDKIAIKKCTADNNCEVIDKKEYDKAVAELEVAPVAVA